MKISEILNEAVGGQYLYHGVPNGRIMSTILQTGMIQPSGVFDFDVDPGGDNSPRISLTRNQHLHFPYGNGVAQFVIDKDVLKQKGYKIKPAVGAMISHKGETEERIFKPIPVTAPYVVEIQYDPDLKIPKTFLDQVKDKGIKLTPWRKETRNLLAQIPGSKGPNSATKYTDPNKLYINSQDSFGDKVYTIGYITDNGSSDIIQPYYRIKDKQIIDQAYITIKDRIKQGLAFDDLLPTAQSGKNWQKGSYAIRPGEKGYKEY